MQKLTEPMDLRPALQAALEAARHAAAHLHAEWARPDGPRGPRGKCPADDEAEALIRDLLMARFPEHGFRGEETGQTGPRQARCLWVVDPNDGTTAMQDGGRGASVSIALLRDRQPVLGVVLAYAAPLGGADCFSWAEGCGPLLRNGQPVRRTWADALSAAHTLVISQAADDRSEANARLCAPARFRAMVSLAYRMALVAAGDGEVATSLGGPQAHDFAAGHALLRGVGGVVLDRQGRPVVYDEGGACDPGGGLFAGNPTLTAQIAARDWSTALGSEQPAPPPPLLRSTVRHRFLDDAVLNRAQGCLLGQVAGDDLGATVEFSPGADVRRRYPDGLRALVDGGHWGTLAGQPTDDSELALALARALVEAGGFDEEAVARAYARWVDSHPFDMGGTTAQALGAASAAQRAGRPAAPAAQVAANRDSQANGALMRVSPLAVWGWKLPEDELIAAAFADSKLSHPHPVNGAASAVFCCTLAAALRGQTHPQALHTAALATAGRIGQAEIADSLRAAVLGPPTGADGAQQGWVRIALQNAYHQLLTAPSVEEGLARTVALGGDTDTNAAIAGALLGAVHGAHSLPPTWIDRVLTCRPLDGLPGVRRPRPRWCWPVDLLVLAEALLALGARRG